MSTAMILFTHHSTCLAYSRDRGLHHRPYVQELGVHFLTYHDGALAPVFASLIPNLDVRTVWLGDALGTGVTMSRDGMFACAQPDGSVSFDRTQPSEWETFWPEDPDQLAFHRQPGFSPESEMQRFAAEVERLNREGLPVRVYCGSGQVPRPGFLNLDILVFCRKFAADHPNQYFIFPFADRGWGLPDNSVDFIFHEDFIEHVPQIMQWQFLAETRRVLKPGGINRVNTPDLIEAMRLHSDFSKGFDGVYTGELRWGHVSVLSKIQLEEMARLIGYSEVHFMKRNESLSPYMLEDIRPGDDRDWHTGNFFADLKK